MSADLRGYMMANDMNYTTFDSMVATSYQHCLAQENLNIAESMAKIALDHRNQPGITLSNFLLQLSFLDYDLL